MSNLAGITCPRCGRLAPITDEDLAGGGGDPSLPTMLPVPDRWMNVPESAVDDDEYDGLHQPEFDPDRIMCEEHASPAELAAWLAREMAANRAVEREYEVETGRTVEHFDFDGPLDDSGEPR